MCLIQKKMVCKAEEALSRYLKGDRKICSPRSDEPDLESHKGGQQWLTGRSVDIYQVLTMASQGLGWAFCMVFAGVLKLVHNEFQSFQNWSESPELQRA